MSRRYPQRPLVGVGGVVFTRDLSQVLLVLRGAQPAKGLWSVPGGLAETGEPLMEACAREVSEETGLDVQLGGVAKIMERIIPDQEGKIEYHYIIVDFWGQSDAEAPRPASDAAAARWTAVQQVTSLPRTLGLNRVVQRARELCAGKEPAGPLMETVRGAS